jgi:hypothetical protein
MSWAPRSAVRIDPFGGSRVLRRRGPGGQEPQGYSTDAPQSGHAPRLRRMRHAVKPDAPNSHFHWPRTIWLSRGSKSHAAQDGHRHQADTVATTSPATNPTTTGPPSRASIGGVRCFIPKIAPTMIPAVKATSAHTCASNATALRRVSGKRQRLCRTFLTRKAMRCGSARSRCSSVCPQLTIHAARRSQSLKLQI